MHNGTAQDGIRSSFPVASLLHAYSMDRHIKPTTSARVGIASCAGLAIPGELEEEDPGAKATS